MKASDFKIPRDPQYQKTFARDMRRQQVRRWMHRLNCLWEEAVQVPRWKTSLGSPRKKLSVCIITMNAAHRIIPLLEYLRPVVDEIVVGVDSKTTDSTFEVCQGRVDELFWIENDALTCNAGLEALVRHCHGDWILRLDDDEFPEPHLWKLIPGIMASGRFTHYKLPRLHLCSVEPLQWINDGYLYPDFQMRLFQNEPSLLSFPGAVGHSSIQCEGPRGRLNTVNLLHLNLAINPRFKREEKLEKYIVRHQGGWVHPINEHALLFEDFQYHIEPYRYPNADFCARLTATVTTQYQAYLETLSLLSQ